MLNARREVRFLKAYADRKARIMGNTAIVRFQLATLA